jgi:hypothetical protein
MKYLALIALLMTGCVANKSATSNDTPEKEGPVEIQGTAVAPRGASGQQGLMNRTVRVYFRRDALGYAGPVPLDPVMASTGGRSMTVEGVVRAVEPDWITVEAGTGQMRLIRGEAILLIEVVP